MDNQFLHTEYEGIGFHGFHLHGPRANGKWFPFTNNFVPGFRNVDFISKTEVQLVDYRQNRIYVPQNNINNLVLVGQFFSPNTSLQPVQNYQHQTERTCTSDSWTSTSSSWNRQQQPFITAYYKYSVLSTTHNNSLLVIIVYNCWHATCTS